MRTTLTLDPDVNKLLRRATQRSKRPFKQVLNDALRAGLARQSAQIPPFVQPTFALGRSPIDLTKALSLDADLADQHQTAKLVR